MKKYLSIPIWIIIFGFTFFILSQSNLVKADFNANDLIDDYTFDNFGTMNEGQINAFLNAFPNSCLSQNNGFSAPDLTGYSPGTGFTYGGNVTAGAVIAHAAQAYGINPQVILSTLEKESSVVTGNASYHCQYMNTSMGYDCPDSGSCPRNPATESGFSKQVIHAAWLLKFGEQRSEGNTSWSIVSGNWNNSDDPGTCYGGPMTQGYRKRCSSDQTAIYYDGITSIDGSNVHMDTGGTATLYWYTPHFHGNQNFDAIFQAWFGPTTGQGFEKVISDDPNDLRQWVVDGNIKQYIPDSQTLTAWNLINVPLTTMPAAQLAAIPTGPTFTRLTRVNGDPSTVFFVDSGNRYIVPWQSMMNTWNLNGLSIDSVTAGLLNQTGGGGYLTNSIKDPGSSNIYMLDGANGSNQTILRQYSSPTVFHAWEGDSASYISVSSDYFSTINSAIGAVLTGTEASYNGVNYQIVNGTRFTEPSSLSTLFPTASNALSTATFNRLVAVGMLSQFIRDANAPTVYLMDAGLKHAVASSSVLNAWLPPGDAITIVNSNYVSLLSSGNAVANYTADNGSQLYLMAGSKFTVPASLDAAYRTGLPPLSVSVALTNLSPQASATLPGFVKGLASPNIYLLDNSGHKRLIEYPDKATLLGAYSSGVITLSDDAINSISSAASPQTFVNDGTTSYLIEGGIKHPVSGSVLTDWGLSSPQVFSDSTLSRFTTGSAMVSKLRDGNSYYLVKEGRAFLTVDSNIAGAWGIADAPQMDSQLITSRMFVYMLTRFVRSTSDSRTFVIDQGQWYNLSNAQLANLGGVGAPTMGLNPADAPNSITDWTSIVVKDGNGKYYVIDGGTKRGFANSIIQNAWTGNGALTVPTASNGFLDSLSDNGNIERAIKGGGPSVYSAEDGTKRHILYPDTYQLHYAPYILVSDALINALPNGSDI